MEALEQILNAFIMVTFKTEVILVSHQKKEKKKLSGYLTITQLHLKAAHCVWLVPCISNFKKIYICFVSINHCLSAIISTLSNKKQ